MKLAGRRGYASTRGRGGWYLVRIATLALGVVGLSTATCYKPGSRPRIIYCHDSDNCQDYPDLVCLDELCVCPKDGETYCLGGCRPLAKCAPIEDECVAPADCPPPSNPRCGLATCEDNQCGILPVTLSKIESQIRGDCRHLWCDGFGHLTPIDDGEDTYDDGSECTLDVCEAGEPKALPFGNGNTCPETGKGVCFNDACVECIDATTDCAAGLACDGGRCVNPHCINAQWDQALGETANDCGGPCRPCEEGSACKVNADCAPGVCKSNQCQPPTCSDGARNEDETGIDCGGPPSCPRCPAGQGCKLGSDCKSGVCWAGVCEPPTCTDGIKNGDEADWDCGGPCPPCP